MEILERESLLRKDLLLVDMRLPTLMGLAFDTSGEGSVMVNPMPLSSISIRGFFHSLLLNVGTVCILLFIGSVRLNSQLKSLLVGQLAGFDRPTCRHGENGFSRHSQASRQVDAAIRLTRGTSKRSQSRKPWQQRGARMIRPIV